MTSWTPTPSWALFFSEQLWFLIILFKTSNWNRWIPPFSQCGFFTSCLTTSQPSGISNCIISVQIRCSVVYMPSVFLFIWIGTPIYFPSAKWPSPVQHATNGERGRNGNWGDLCSWIGLIFRDLALSGWLPCCLLHTHMLMKCLFCSPHTPLLCKHWQTESWQYVNKTNLTCTWGLRKVGVRLFSR